MGRRRWWPIWCLGVGVVAHSVTAAPPRCIFTSIAASPSSLVPGQSLWRVRVGSGDVAFPYFAISPDGQRWVVCAGVEVGAANTRAIITGSGATRAGARTIAMGGQNSYIPGRVYDSLELTVGVNNAGQVAFAGNLSGTTIDDQFCARDSNGVIAEVAREGQPAAWIGTGVSYGVRLDGAGMLENGSLRYRAFLTGGGGGEAMLESSAPGSGMVLARTGFTTPAAQLVGTPQTLAFFVADAHAFVPAGSIYVARLNGPSATDMICVRSNTTWAQEGTLVPGSGFASPVRVLAPQTRGVATSPSGVHATCIGENTDGTDWVMHNGAIVVRRGDFVAPQTGERFSDTRASYAFAGAWPLSDGRVVVAAYTDGPAQSDSVLVLLGERVLLREGDALDLDGDGATDDVYVGDFAPGGVVMTDAQRVFASCSIRNGAGQSLGAAWITFDARTCNDIDFNNDELFPDTADVDDFLSVFAGGQCPTGSCDDIDFNRDGLFPDTLDIDVFLGVFAGGEC